MTVQPPIGGVRKQALGPCHRFWRSTMIFTTMLVAMYAVAAKAVAADYAWPVVRVVDGDTIQVDASANMPPELASIKVRLRGVDTPDKGRWAKCEAEKRAAFEATDFTKRTIGEAASIVVRDPSWGKWGGRVIANLILDGRPLSALLIEAGHGRAYDGGKRRSWCPK